MASPEHPLAKAGGATLAGLKKERLILRTPQAEARRLLDDSLARRSDSIGNFHVILETDSLGTIRELVASGLGVSILPLSACREALRSGVLTEVPIRDFHLAREICILHTPDFSRPELLEELRRIYLAGG